MADLQSIIEVLQGAESQNDAFAKFSSAIKGYGYDRVGFSLMTDHPSIGHKAFHWQSSSFPGDWMAHYLENNFHIIDPVFQRVLQKPGPFFWSDAVDALDGSGMIEAQFIGRSKTMMHEAADAGLADGIGVSLVNEMGEIAGLGISRSEQDTAKDMQAFADIYLLSFIFHEKYMSFFAPMDLPQLTRREKDVLLWSASGKTDWEIAQITGISQATVRFHWANIFKKMGVNNKLTATMNAVRRKIIVPDTLRPALAASGSDRTPVSG
jgi:DNA-binding CsgD family transcriptional regulator